MNTNPRRKVILAVAPVGKHDIAPAINPLSPEAVAAEVIACQRAGASMVHLHVRDRLGEQTEDLEAYSKTLDLIRESSEIIIQGSTGGLTRLSLEQRCVSLNDPRTEVASLNMGSVNFGEEVYINRLPDIRFWARRMHETDVAPELEIFEAGMMPVMRQLVEEGCLRPPFSVNFCLGAHWAMPAEPKSLFFLTSMLGEAFPWGVIHEGMRDLSLIGVAIGLGASVVRVGFEDSIYLASDKRAATNVDLVENLADLVRTMGCEAATPEEARAILGI
jgi:3-keto-5-aminohexanoate cleavage enzyme